LDDRAAQSRQGTLFLMALGVAIALLVAASMVGALIRVLVVFLVGGFDSGPFLGLPLLFPQLLGCFILGYVRTAQRGWWWCVY
jgi:hypothetical protein